MVEHAEESLLYPLVHAKLYEKKRVYIIDENIRLILVFNSRRSTSSNTSIARSSKS
jgi:hypothetical protein